MRKRFRKYFLDLFRTSKNKYYISCVILSASDCFEKYKKTEHGSASLVISLNMQMQCLIISNFWSVVDITFLTLACF